MAEPLGIVGLISVAGQIFQVIGRLGLDWKDAPAETARCLTEIHLLNALLSDAEKHTLRTLSVDLEAAVVASISACYIELMKLHQDLVRRVSGRRVGWERLKGAFGTKRTREAVEDLQRRCLAISTSTSRDALLSVKDGVADLRASQQQMADDRNAKAIINWISAADYGPQQSDLIGRRQEETV